MEQGDFIELGDIRVQKRLTWETGLLPSVRKQLESAPPPPGHEHDGLRHIRSRLRLAPALEERQHALLRDGARLGDHYLIAAFSGDPRRTEPIQLQFRDGSRAELDPAYPLAAKAQVRKSNARQGL